MEEDYEQGLRKYDQRRDEINKLIQTQTGEFHSKIRNDFLARKQRNDMTNSQFTTKTLKSIKN